MRPVWLATLAVLGCVAAGCGSATDASPVTPAASPTTPVASSPAPPSPRPVSLPSAGTWQIASMNFLTGDLGWIMARDIAPNGAWTAVAVFRTRDGGTHWTPVAVFNAQTPVPGPQSEGPGLSPISQLNFQSPAQGNAVVSLGAGACQAGYAVLATPDGGGHWTATTPSPILAQDGPVATSFPQGGSGPGWFVNGSCAGAYVQVFKRSSGGKVWTHLTNVPTANLSPNALNFRMTTSQTGYLVDASNGYGPHASMLELNLTQDGGAHWTQSTLPSQGLPNNITQLSFTSPHQGWVVTAQQNQPFHVYALSGTGWTAMATPDSSANTPPLADRVSGRIGYLAQNTSQGISLFKTVDGGQEWIPLTFPSR